MALAVTPRPSTPVGSTPPFASFLVAGLTHPDVSYGLTVQAE